jgi:hypothetical protein
MAEPARITLYPDYSARWPVWDGFGMVEPVALGVSRRLMDALSDWQEFFEEHFHHERGWDDRASERQFSDRGHELVHRLRAELPDADVALDLWTSRS